MATEIKKIWFRMGNKNDLIIADLQPGEPVLALDTNEVGIKSSAGVMVWFATLDPVTEKLKQMPNADDVGARYIGEVKEIAYDTADAGWLLCQGQEVNRTKYAALFAKIGTKYGAGDGSTTFNIPNRCGRVGIGLDPGDADFNALGKTGGEKKHKLTIDEMPSHAHAILAPNDAAPGTHAAIAEVAEATTNKTFWAEMTRTNSAGGDQPHNILPPYEVSNFEIYTGVFN